MSAVRSPTLRFGSLRRQPIVEHGGLILGGAIAAIAVALALVGPYIAPYSTTNGQTGAQLQPPSGAHWLGTDPVGLDVFSRVIAAPRTDITIALLATLLALGVGTPLGAIAGYYRNAWSELLMRTSDLI